MLRELARHLLVPVTCPTNGEHHHWDQHPVSATELTLAIAAVGIAVIAGLRSTWSP